MLSRFCFALYLSCFFLTLFSTAVSAGATVKKSPFTTYNIDVPFNISQPILPVNILENPGIELVVIGADEQQKRWLAIYIFDEKKQEFILFDQQVIPNKFFAYDVTDLKNKNTQQLQTLYFLARDEVASYQFLPSLSSNSATPISQSVFVKKQTVNSMYLVDKADYLAAKDFIMDVNHDNVDDIVLQGFEQINLWLSNCCDELHAQALPLTAFVELHNNGISFNQRSLFFADLNFDKRDDIAWVNKGNIEYYQQLNSGIFASQSEHVALNENIYGLNWWDIREADGDNLDQSKLSHRMVEKIQDVNGDGLVDVIVRFTKSSGVLERTNDYEFYYGAKKNGQLIFLAEPNTTIKAEGTLTGLNIIDINNDNKFEIMLSSFELSLTNIIGALLSGGIDQDVLLFSQGEQGIFGENPVTSKEVELSFSLSKGRSGEPVVILSDINGDGLQDLLLSDDDALKIYLGQDRQGLFAKKSIKQKVILPQNGQNIQKYDLNLDGKQDLVMHYGRLDEVNRANKLTLLMAN